MVSVGYPGPILGGQPTADPPTWGVAGWRLILRRLRPPVKVVDRCRHAGLGELNGGKMLFLGLGTGLGTALIVDGMVEPMELGHLPYKKRTYEHYVGRAGLEHDGEKKWQRHVADVVERLIAALRPDDTVIGGGNVR